MSIPYGTSSNITQYFVPNLVNIHVADTIEWIIEDTTIHNVNGIEVMAIDAMKSKHTEDLGSKISLFDSKILFLGAKFYQTFDRGNF